MKITIDLIGKTVSLEEEAIIQEVIDLLSEILTEQEEIDSEKETLKESLTEEDDELLIKIKTLADEIRNYSNSKRFQEGERALMISQYRAMFDYHVALQTRIKSLEK